MITYSLSDLQYKGSTGELLSENEQDIYIELVFLTQKFERLSQQHKALVKFLQVAFEERPAIPSELVCVEATEALPR